MAELTLPQYDFTDDVLRQAWADTSPRDEEDVEAAAASNVAAFDDALVSAEDFDDLRAIANDFLFYFDESHFEGYISRELIQDVYNDMTVERDDAEASGQLDEWMADRGDEYEAYADALENPDDVEWFTEGGWVDLVPMSAEEVEEAFDNIKFDMVGTFCSAYGEL